MSTTPDLHIVIEAKRQRGQGDWLYRIVSPATDWRSAQAQWDKLDDQRRILGSRLHEHHYMVRSDTDPRWAHLPRPGVYRTTKSRDGREKAARALAATLHITGKQGGWLYDAHDRPIEQGWFGFATRMASCGRIKPMYPRDPASEWGGGTWFIPGGWMHEATAVAS